MLNCFTAVTFLIVPSMSSLPQPNVLAYAVHCQTDTHGRPVAGVVVICRDSLTGATYSHQAIVQVRLIIFVAYFFLQAVL